MLPGYRVATPETPRALWHVVDDRGTYRPGETVRIKGWVRGLSADRQLQAWDRDEVGYVAYDGYGVEVARGTAEIGPAGSFTLEFDLPAGASTGTGWIALDEGQAWGTTHELTIAEYRRPDFEVTTSAGAGPHRRGESIAATAQADYYTGGPLGDAAVTWQVTTSEATYDPPGWDRFDFGRWMPWWSGDLFVDGRGTRSSRCRAAFRTRRRWRRSPAAPTPPARTISICASATSTPTSTGCRSRCAPTPPCRTSTAR